MTTPAAPRASLETLAALLLVAAVAARFTIVESIEPLSHLFQVGLWLLVWTLATLGYGAPITRRFFRREPGDADAAVVALAAGATVLAAVAGGLGAVGLLHAIPLLGTLGLGALLGGVELRRLVVSPLELTPRLTLPLALAGLAGLATLLVAAAPAPFYDQIHYHLAFPWHWLRAGEIFVFPRHSYSYFAANMGLLYTYALAGPGEWGAQLIHAWMAFLAGIAVYRLGARFGGTAAGGWALAIWAATPTVLESATWATSDLGAAAFGMVALLIVVIGAHDDESLGPRAYGLAGLFVGMALGSKYLAGATVCVPVGLALLADGIARWRRGATLTTGLRRFAFLVLAACLAYAPWGIRNATLTGDPFYPFLGDLLSSSDDAPSWLGESASVADIAAQIVTLRTFQPRGAAGNIGPIYLALVPLWILAVARRRDRVSVVLLVAVIAGVLGWAASPRLGRYLIPVLAPMAAASGYTWSRIVAGAPRNVARALVLILTLLLSWNLLSSHGPTTLVRVENSLGRVTGDQLLEYFIDYWPAVAAARELPENAKLLFVAEPRSMYFERDVIVEDPFGTPFLVEVAEAATSVREVRESLAALGATHLLYNSGEGARIAQFEGRQSYFSAASPEATARIERFFLDCLDPILSGDRVSLYSLTDCH